MEQKNVKKHLLIAIPTYLVVIAATILLCLFVPKACQKKETTQFKLDVACSNSTVDNQTELHNFYPENDVVTLTFKANNNYSLPEDVKATSGNQQLVKDTDYTYSKDTGAFSFNIHGDTNIVVDAISNYQVTFVLEVPADTGTQAVFFFKEDYSYYDTYPGLVDWGDGTTDNKISHYYEPKDEAKTYHVTIFDYTYDFFAFDPGSGYSSGDYVTSIVLSSSIKKIGDYAFQYCRNLTSINIPSSVTSIGEDAFSSCTSLTSISVDEGNTVYDSRNNCNAIIETSSNTLISGCANTIIPGTVTSIGYDAFYRCPSLISITIPSSVTSIGGYAFCNCDNLQTVSFEEGSQLTSIGEYAFSWCRSLTSIVISKSVTSIGGSAFSYCSDLQTFNFEEGNQLTSIGDYAFSSCSSLASITIPNSVTAIGNGAFSSCTSLTSITIPNSVTSIGNYAFSSCSSLISFSVAEGNTIYDSRNNCNAIIRTSDNTLISGCKNTIIPNGVTSIDTSAFSGCSSLTSIAIPNGVTSIGNYAFSNCTSLTSITIPNGVTSIGNGAFSYCSSLTSIIIPDSITSIGYDAFHNINTNAVVDMSSVDHLIVLTDDIFNTYTYSPDKFVGTIRVKSSQYDAYRTANFWKNTADRFVRV